MGRYIAKFNGHYCEWSTVTDSPVTYLMPLDEFRSYYLGAYGTEGMRHLDERMARVEVKGCSSMVGDTPATLAQFNRAGPNETTLDAAGLWREYGTEAREREHKKALAAKEAGK